MVRVVHHKGTKLLDCRLIIQGGKTAAAEIRRRRRHCPHRQLTVVQHLVGRMNRSFW